MIFFRWWVLLSLFSTIIDRLAATLNIIDIILSVYLMELDVSDIIVDYIAVLFYNCSCCWLLHFAIYYAINFMDIFFCCCCACWRWDFCTYCYCIQCIGQPFVAAVVFIVYSLLNCLYVIGQAARYLFVPWTLLNFKSFIVSFW